MFHLLLTVYAEIMLKSFEQKIEIRGLKMMCYLSELVAKRGESSLMTI